MRITNKRGLPAYLVDWLKSDDYDYNYDPNTISATSILKPTRQQLITQRHVDDLEIDVLDLVANRYGNAIHDSVERIQTPGVQKERRVVRELTIEGQVWKITGKFDILVQDGDKFTLRDIKSTSVWSFIFGGKDEDYRTQLSIYRWLLSTECSVEQTAYIDFFFTDWQASKAKIDDTYPRNRIQPGYRIDLLSLEETEKLIRDKIIEIINNRDKPDDELPLCTKEELWAEEDTWAVMKIGNKRATKLCDSQKAALEYISNNSLKAEVVHREGKIKRCKYCSAAPFCNQFKDMRAKGLVDEWS